MTLDHNRLKSITCDRMSLQQFEVCTITSHLKGFDQNQSHNTTTLVIVRTKISKNPLLIPFYIYSLRPMKYL